MARNGQRTGPNRFTRTGLFLDTRGQSVLSVAICDRCRFKVYYSDLMPDQNFPGLRVCPACRDDKDPYRLPARMTEKITIRFPRPDESIAITDDNALLNNEYYSAPLADQAAGLSAQQQTQDVNLGTEQIVKRTGFESLTQDLPTGPTQNG